MDTQEQEDQSRVRALAQGIECMTDEEMSLLAKVTPATLESWRKHGKGPAYALIGNRYLYPKAAVAEFVQANVRDRPAQGGAGAL